MDYTELKKYDGVLAELKEHVESTEHQHYAEGPHDVTLFSPNFQPGHNMAQVVKYVSRYVTSGHEKSRNRKDLLKAAHYILFELIRTKGE